MDELTNRYLSFFDLENGATIEDIEESYRDNLYVWDLKNFQNQTERFKTKTISKIKQYKIAYNYLKKNYKGNIKLKEIPKIEEKTFEGLIKENLALLGHKPGDYLIEVKEAYRDMVTAWHPDRHIGKEKKFIEKAEAKLKKIIDAYKWLEKNYLPEDEKKFSDNSPSPNDNIHVHIKERRDEFVDSEGNVYKGIFINKKLVKGQKICKLDNCIEEGKFEDMSLVEGKKTYEDGTTYEGKFDKLNKCLVNGKLSSKTWIIEGEFKPIISDDGWVVRTAQATASYLVEGSKTYIGKGEYFEESLGKNTWKRKINNGDKEVGEFSGTEACLKNGKRIYSDGTVEEGTFDDAGFIVRGKKTYKNGSVYSGTFNKGEPPLSFKIIKSIKKLIGR